MLRAPSSTAVYEDEVLGMLRRKGNHSTSCHTSPQFASNLADGGSGSATVIDDSFGWMILGSVAMHTTCANTIIILTPPISGTIRWINPLLIVFSLSSPN